MDASTTISRRGSAPEPNTGRRTSSTTPQTQIPSFKPGTVNLSTFSYLFSELIQYSQSRVDNTGDLERRLEEVGRVVGASLLELLHARNSIPPSGLPKSLDAAVDITASKSSKYSGGSPLLYQSQSGVRYAPNNVVRYTRILDILRFLYTTVWKYLFNKQATDLQQSNENSDEYMISDEEAHLWIGRYVSVPKDMGNLNVNAWLGGVVQGVLDGAGFRCVRVTAHFVPVQDTGVDGGEGQAGQGRQQRVTLLIKFDPAVIERERELERAASSSLL